MTRLTRSEKAIQKERKRVLRILRLHRYGLEQVMLWPRLENLIRNGYDVDAELKLPAPRRTIGFH